MCAANNVNNDKANKNPLTSKLFHRNINRASIKRCNEHFIHEFGNKLQVVQRKTQLAVSLTVPDVLAQARRTVTLSEAQTAHPRTSHSLLANVHTKRVVFMHFSMHSLGLILTV